MFKKGLEVVIIGLPPRDEMWGLPMELVGLSGVIISVEGNRCIVRTNRENHHWTFPCDKSILQIVSKNKWNPLGYVPRLESLKLP